MKIFEFYSDFQLGEGEIVKGYDEAMIEAEPMLFKAESDFAFAHGGPITRAFLEALLKSRFLNASTDVYIDSRSHMLMKHWYPCIPGWHHDDVPRTAKDNQPNYYDESYFASHAMLLINSYVSPTEFVRGEFQMPEVEKGIVYQEWDKRVEMLLRTCLLDYERQSAPNNQIVYFDARTFHQGTPARGNGWRFFIRATKNSKVKAENKIRRNANVYLPAPFAGW